jgi:hypothetical protein
MINILMGNVYNVQQVVVPPSKATVKDASKVGLDQWKTAVRKELMEKLRSYSPDQIDKIIASTFGSEYI